MMQRTLAIALAMAALPLAAAAQTLPQSTQDRQHIANLEYQATLPGTSAATRAAIEREIAALQYRINTNPPIAPMPTLAPTWNTRAQFTLQAGSLPQLGRETAPLAPSVYGSCSMNAAVVTYLTQQLSLPTTTTQERDWDRQRIGDLQRRMRASNCPR